LTKTAFHLNEFEDDEFDRIKNDQGEAECPQQ